ncbi:MAG: glycosyltransferase [Ardenticatenales bacterium]|nr:glycosyltransferase [Ardenticatenales bacterium]
MRVSVITTVLNEGESIRTLLDTLTHQSRLPDEVLITDGGSTDDTLAVLHEYARNGRLPLNILSAPGSNISEGRNVAIRAASGPIIATTDAGVHLSPDWLSKLVAPIQAGSAISAGFFLPDPKNLFETAMGATVLPHKAEIDPESFLPSSRSVAFLKESWEAVGGYPEWLDYCEDLIFDMRLRDRHGPFTFVPDAVAHFRPRGSLGSFFTQYYRYARGDGKADLWRVRHAIRYVTYLLGIPLIIWLAITHSGWFWGLFLLGGAAYTHRPAVHLWPALAAVSLKEKLAALTLIPIIRLVGDAAKMIGYPVGVWWRLTSGRAQDWRAAMAAGRGRGEKGVPAD